MHRSEFSLSGKRNRHYRGRGCGSFILLLSGVRWVGSGSLLKSTCFLSYFPPGCFETTFVAHDVAPVFPKNGWILRTWSFVHSYRFSLSLYLGAVSTNGTGGAGGGSKSLYVISLKRLGMNSWYLPPGISYENLFFTPLKQKAEKYEAFNILAVFSVFKIL